jgi:serine/threonine protein phosphatase 1
MGRTLVIGDIHGGLKALVQLLERAKITPEDEIIFLGDYVDGWSDSANVVTY